MITKGNRNRRWVWGIFVVAALYLAAVYVVPGFLDKSDGRGSAGGCVAPQKTVVDHGEHSGRPWHITAEVDKNPGCSFWILKVTFFPQNQLRGSWTEGWGIQAGGHLPATATIDARDYEDDGGRLIGGVVGIRVKEVMLKMSGGRTITIYPQDPTDELLKRFGWLHGLRYVLFFYSSGEHVRKAKLLDGKGKVIYTAHSLEGEILGNMVY